MKTCLTICLTLFSGVASSTDTSTTASVYYHRSRVLSALFRDTLGLFRCEEPDYPPTTPAPIAIITPVVTPSPTPVRIWNRLGLDVEGATAADAIGSFVDLSYDGYVMIVVGTLNLKLYQHSSSAGWAIWADLYSSVSATFDSVALSGNGLHMIVGDSTVGAGNIQTLSYTSSTWSVIRTVEGTADGDEFGYALDMTKTGNRVAVGAPGGSYVTVFDFQGSSTYTRRTYDGTGTFGSTLSMSSDGGMMVVGKVTEGASTGSVAVFNLATLSEVTVTTGVGAFGYALSISGDKTTFAIGTSTSNFVRVFRMAANSDQYTQVGEDIFNTDGTNFGSTLSLSDDGRRMVVGAAFDDGGSTERGRTFVFAINDDSWKLLEELNGEGDNDESGTSVSMSGDGTIIVIGAPKNDGSAGVDTGHVRAYRAS